MGHNDGLGPVAQYSNSKPSHSHSKPLHDKLTYRLFPTANQQPQVSPKTLQQQTLQRNGSFNKRRSASLDESSRPPGVARMPFSRPGDAPVPRIQQVPTNRVKVTKADPQDRTCTSHGHDFRTGPDDRKAQAPKILLYKPRVSEDAGHGRSSSAPDDMRAEVRPRKPTGLAHMTNSALNSSAKVVRGLGGTWYNPHDSTIAGPTREGTKGSYHKRDLTLEKPLPLPPKDSDLQTNLDPYHSRSHSTPLSPGPRNKVYTGDRSDSVTNLTPLVTPSSLDPNRKSYFPLSADAQMRQLMGFSPIDEDQNQPAQFHSRGKSHGKGIPLLLPSSKYQEPVNIPVITIKTEAAEEKATNSTTNGDAQPPQPTSAPAEQPRLVRPSLPSPTLSHVSARMMPAALRITSPKRSASVSATLDRKPVPLQNRLGEANDGLVAQTSETTASQVEEESAKTLSVLSELTTQTNALHARYASLREDRQMLLGEISQGLKEQRAGPDYVNTIFDKHMSLATVCSSMDICLAKLKAVARRKDTLIQTLATKPLPPRSSSLPSIQEQKPSPATLSSQPAPAIPSMHKLSHSTPTNLLLRKASSTNGYSKSEHNEAMRRFRSKMDIDYDTDDSDVPKRMNIKGAKAAKILGLAIEPDSSNSETRSPESSAVRPTHTLKTNHSTTSLDRDLFMRTPSPAPVRPLPARPSVRKTPREHVPAPLPLQPVDKAVVEKVSHSAKHSIGDSTVSSRASSPAEERGAETPHEEYPSFDPKSPGMQTVHVYFPESNSGTASLHSGTWSEVGEDELLAYYGYLK